MSGLRRLCLLALTLTLFAAGGQGAHSETLAPTIDPKIKTEMKALQAKIKADRTYLKEERERLRPIVARLKANNEKLRALREKVKAQRDAQKAQLPQSDKAPAGLLDDDPLDDLAPAMP